MLTLSEVDNVNSFLDEILELAIGVGKISVCTIPPFHEISVVPSVTTTTFGLIPTELDEWKSKCFASTKWFGELDFQVASMDTMNEQWNCEVNINSSLLNYVIACEGNQHKFITSISDRTITWRGTTLAKEELAQTNITMRTANSNNPKIVMLGLSGHGKSYITNNLCYSAFPDSTSNIQTSTFTYQNMEYDVIDSASCLNYDKETLRLIDLLKHSTIQCFLVVSESNIDSKVLRFINDFIKQNKLLDNIICIRNKVTEATTDIIQLPESLFSLKSVSVAYNQHNLAHLMEQIIKCKPTNLLTLMLPQLLFKQPIEDVKSREVEEFVTTKVETMQKVERIIDTQVDKGHSEPQYEWIIRWGINTNRKRQTGVKWISNIVTTYKDVIVDKKVIVDIVNKYKLYYATRQDGVVDIYKKEFIEQKQIVKESTT